MAQVSYADLIAALHEFAVANILPQIARLVSADGVRLHG